MNYFIVLNEDLKYKIRQAITHDKLTNQQKEYLNSFMQLKKVLYLRNLDKHQQTFKIQGCASHHCYFQRYYIYFNQIPNFDIQITIVSSFEDIKQFYQFQYGIFWLEFEADQLFMFKLTSKDKAIKPRKLLTFEQMRDTSLIMGDYCKDAIVFLENFILSLKKDLKNLLQAKQTEQAYQLQELIAQVEITCNTILKIFKQETHCFEVLITTKRKFIQNFITERQISVGSIANLMPNFLLNSYSKNPQSMFEKLFLTQQYFIKIERILKKEWLIQNNIILIDDQNLL